MPNKFPERWDNALFLEKLNSKFNGTIEALSEYYNRESTISFRCKACGHTWETTARKILDKRVTFGCKKCSARRHGELSQERFIPTLEEFWQRVKLLPNIDYVEGYINTSKNCLWKCNICEYQWKTNPNNILNRGTGCPNCARIALITPVEKIIDTVNDLYVNSISYVDGYVDKRKKCKWKCNLCGYEWSSSPNNIIRTGSCQNCKMSSGERKIKLLLDQNHIDYAYQYSFIDLKGITNWPLRFDFAVFSNGKVAHVIEFDGRQHEKAVRIWGGQKQFDMIQRNDKIKNEYCSKNNIKLIRIKDRRKFDFSHIKGDL